MDAKECPLCGARMRLHARKQTLRVHSSREPKISRFSEWVCPDCDYFEEAEES